MTEGEKLMAEIVADEWHRYLAGIGNSDADPANDSEAGDGADGQPLSLPHV